MAKPRVFVSRVIPQAALNLLSAHVALEVNAQDKPLDKAELISRIQGKEGLVCLLTDLIDDELLGSSPSLRVVSNVAVGFDNIDVKAATRRMIAVTNTPGVLDNTTADFTWALLMATARRVVEADRYARAGKYQGWGIMLLLGHDVHGKTLGICGMGRIGKAVARRAKGFGMKILYTDVQRIGESLERELGVEFVDKETLLRESDFVTLHLPLLPETAHYISRRELSLMKKTSHLINASRGPVVDEEALAEALKAKQIAGAALDVYEHEPKIHPGLIDLENVVLAPHIASASIDTRTRMATMAAENMLAALEGKIPPNIVNPEIYNRSQPRKEQRTHGEK